MAKYAISRSSKAQKVKQIERASRSGGKDDDADDDGMSAETAEEGIEFSLEAAVETAVDEDDRSSNDAASEV